MFKNSFLSLTKKAYWDIKLPIISRLFGNKSIFSKWHTIGFQFSECNQSKNTFFQTLRRCSSFLSLSDLFHTQKSIFLVMFKLNDKNSFYYLRTSKFLILRNVTCNVKKYVGLDIKVLRLPNVFVIKKNKVLQLTTH